MILTIFHKFKVPYEVILIIQSLLDTTDLLDLGVPYCDLRVTFHEFKRQLEKRALEDNDNTSVLCN